MSEHTHPVLVFRNPKPRRRRRDTLPAIARKAAELFKIRPLACPIIEAVIDDLIAERKAGLR